MKSPKLALLWERNPERNLYKFPFGSPSSCTIGMKLIQLPVDPLFVRQMGPSRSNHPNNYIETETRHPFTTAEFALKFLTYCALFLCKFNGYRRTDRTTWRNTEQGVGWGEGGRNMSRTSIPAKGRIAILLVTSRYRNKNTLLLDRHRGSSTDLSLCTK